VGPTVFYTEFCQSSHAILRHCALYVHCAAQNLNVVLNDACQNIPEIRDCWYCNHTTQTLVYQYERHCKTLFCCSSPQELLSAKDDNLFVPDILLAVQYPEDLSPEIPIQFISFCKVLWPAIKKNEKLNSKCCRTVVFLSTPPFCPVSLMLLWQSRCDLTNKDWDIWESQVSERYFGARQPGEENNYYYI
jgi:hypothetical protein